MVTKGEKMNFYEILGIPRNSSFDDIKKAYKTKIKIHHPDLHEGKEKEEHTEIFKNVVLAFETLQDPSKKSLYDLKNPEKRAEKSTVQPKNNKTPILEIAQCMYFGGQSTGRNIMIHVKLTEHERMHGAKKVILFKKRDFCNDCGGIGTGSFICPFCKDHKMAKQVCSHCDTQGCIYGKCNKCNGTGVGEFIKEEFAFSVPKNTPIGHTLGFVGLGECASNKPPGCLRIVLV